MSEVKEILKESLLELSAYIRRATPEIEQLVDDFYGGREEVGLKKIPLLLEGLDWMLQILNHAVPFQSSEFPVELIKRSFLKELKELEEALQYQEWVTFADLLKYQFIPLLDELDKFAEIGADSF